MTVWTYTLPSAFGREAVAGCGLFVHSDLRNVGVAMSRLAGYAEAMARPLPASAADMAVAPLPDDLPHVLTEHRAKALLAPFGLPEAQERLATSAAEAAEAAIALGFPVVLKIASPDLPHKTEAGGVILGLQSQHSVTAAFDQIIQSAKRYKADARIDGVLVQKMAPQGPRAGDRLVNDPTFGPIMMVGIGGTMVELMGDVVHRPAPVDVAEATGYAAQSEVGAAAGGISRRRSDRHHPGGNVDRQSVASGGRVSRPNRGDGVQSGDPAR